MHRPSAVYLMPGGRLRDVLGFHFIFPSLSSICLYSSLNLIRPFAAACTVLFFVTSDSVVEPPQPHSMNTNDDRTIAGRNKRVNGSS
jgi:hypothetical protein